MNLILLNITGEENICAGQVPTHSFIIFQMLIHLFSETEIFKTFTHAIKKCVSIPSFLSSHTHTQKKDKKRDYPFYVKKFENGWSSNLQGMLLSKVKLYKWCQVWDNSSVIIKLRELTTYMHRVRHFCSLSLMRFLRILIKGYKHWKFFDFVSSHNCAVIKTALSRQFDF